MKQHVEPTNEVVQTEDYYRKTYENEYSKESEQEQTSYSSDDDSYSSDTESSDDDEEDIGKTLAAPSAGGTKSQRNSVLQSQQMAREFQHTRTTRSAYQKGRG